MSYFIPSPYSCSPYLSLNNYPAPSFPFHPPHFTCVVASGNPIVLPSLCLNSQLGASPVTFLITIIPVASAEGGKQQVCKEQQEEERLCDCKKSNSGKDQEKHSQTGSDTVGATTAGGTNTAAASSVGTAVPYTFRSSSADMNPSSSPHQTSFPASPSPLLFSPYSHPSSSGHPSGHPHPPVLSPSSPFRGVRVLDQSHRPPLFCSQENHTQAGGETSKEKGEERRNEKLPLDMEYLKEKFEKLTVEERRDFLDYIIRK